MCLPGQRQWNATMAGAAVWKQVVRPASIALLAVSAALPVLGGDQTSSPATVSGTWTNQPWSDPDFFPLAVWLQAPANAERYGKAGFNLYVGLWRGPTEEQLATLKKAGMRVICGQKEDALRRGDSTIIGWMHGDEPDNAQSLGEGKGWGAPVLPEKIVADYQKLQAADPSRPVLLNLGQGVAWDGWYGRGPRKNHPEDYREYLKGCDIASFDIYPATHTSQEVAGDLSFVARGVARLVEWTEGKKPVWNCLECTHIGNPDRKPTPHEVRAEAWMSLIHGSRGLIYFVHQFQPKFIEAALLADPEMLDAVTALNRQITELAPVLNSPTIQGAVTVQSTNAAVPIATMVKHHGGAVYLFAVAMRNQETTATFTLKGIAGSPTAEALGEQRTLVAKTGSFTDHFAPWEVHLYRIQPGTRR